MKLVFSLLFSAALVGGALGLFSAKAEATNYYSGQRWQNSTVVWCFLTSMASWVQNHWNWSYCPYACDYRTIQVHEIGHAVSFVHGGSSSSVMIVNVVKRALNSHDFSSLQAVY